MTLRRLIVALAAAGALAALLGVLVLLALGNAFGTAGWTRLPLAVVDPAAVLPRDAGGRTNVVLFGIREDSEPLLTDTILLVSVDAEKRSAVLISVPRDLAVAFPDGVGRVNEAYHRGADAGDDGANGRRVVGDVLGVDIQRSAAVSIGGLSSIVDDLGGVPVEVEHAFTDAVVENASFDAGWQWMSGERALAFARSRTGGPFESSDFARIRRQQTLLLAIEKRLFAPTTLLDPPRLRRLFGDVVANVHTDLNAEEILGLARVMSRLGPNQIRRVSLAEEGLVVEMRGSEGAYLLAPLGGDFAVIRRRVRTLLGGALAAGERHGAGLDIVGRAEWDPNPPLYAGPAQAIRRVIIHHDGTVYPPGTAGAAKLQDLRAGTARRHGWKDLPYHYAIDSDGRIFEGRDEAWKGDTAALYDASDALQVVLLGDHRLEPPTAAQRQALMALVQREMGEHHLADGDVYLHGDVARTDCPGAATRAVLAGLWEHPGMTPGLTRPASGSQ